MRGHDASCLLDSCCIIREEVEGLKPKNLLESWLSSFLPIGLGEVRDVNSEARVLSPGSERTQRDPRLSSVPRSGEGHHS